MVKSGALDHDVHANPADVDAMFDDAQSHLNSAATLKDSGPRGAYSVMYMGARKALVAALLKQGLRARGGEGGHRTVYDAIHAQLGDPGVQGCGTVRPDATEKKPGRL